MFWLGLILSFGHVPDDMRNSAASYLESYLASRTLSDVSSQRYSDFPVQESVEMISVKVKPDYWKTALRPCQRLNCSSLNRAYRAHITYELEGARLQRVISMKWRGSGYHWHIE